MKFYDSIKFTLWPLTLLICLLVIQLPGSNNLYMQGIAVVTLLVVVLSTPFTFFRIFKWFIALFFKKSIPVDLRSNPLADKKTNLKWEREWIMNHGTNDSLRKQRSEKIKSYKPKFNEQIRLDRKFR